LATPNYGYEKRQRELAKKKKKEEKLKAKTHRRPDEPQDAQPTDGPAAFASPAPTGPSESAGS